MYTKKIEVIKMVGQKHTISNIIKSTKTFCSCKKSAEISSIDENQLKLNYFSHDYEKLFNVKGIKWPNLCNCSVFYFDKLCNEKRFCIDL